MLIEPESASDVDAIGRVVDAAFADQPGVSGMVAAIRDSERYRPELALVARDDTGIVGFVMISGVDLVDGDRVHPVLSLTPLAVTPARQRCGIGSALVHAVLDRADAVGDGLVVLEGDPGYYGRLGFEPARDHGVDIHLPDWAPPEAAQVFRLAAYDAAVHGTVVYPPAIAAVAG